MSRGTEISIATYGAVLGAVAGGAAMDVALAEAGVDPRAWPAADARWAAAIVDAEETAEAFDRAFVEARDARYRPPRPLDGVEGYAGFVAALARADDAIAWAASKGLGVEELALVQAHWARRLRREPDLDERLRSRLRDARPEPDVEPPARRPPAATTPSVLDEDDDDDDDRARADPPARPDALADAMPDPTADAPTGPPTGRGTGAAPLAAGAPARADDAPAPPVERVVPSFMLAREPAAAPPPDAAAPAPPAFRRSRLGATMMGVSLPRGPATPFAAPPARTPTPAPAPAPAPPRAAPPRNPLAGTMHLPEGVAPASPALPFAGGPGARAPDAIARTALPAAGAGQVSPEERAALASYAALCADLAAKAEPRTTVLARHGLDEAGKTALDAHWNDVFQRSGAARVVWLEALAARRRVR